MIIIIIITDIYKAPLLSRAHNALQIYTTSTIHNTQCTIHNTQYTMHKQQSHLITCNLLTKQTHKRARTIHNVLEQCKRKSVHRMT